MDELAARTGRQLRPGGLPRRTGRGARHRRHGLGHRRGRGDRRRPERRGRAGRRRSRSASSSRSRSTQVIAALPSTVRAIAVLDRTKEPGRGRRAAVPRRSSPRSPSGWTADDAAVRRRCPGSSAVATASSSKEVTPAMVKPVFDELASRAPEAPLHRRHLRRRHPPQPADRHDVPACRDPRARSRRCSSASARTAPSAPTRPRSRSSARARTSSPRATSSTTRRSPGSVTVSHLRFGPEPIRSTYLIDGADFVACHQFGLLEQTEVLELAKPGATFLLNSPYGPDEVWDHLPVEVQQQLVDKAIDLWVIDAFAVAERGRDGQPHQHRDAALLLPSRRRPARRTRRSRASRRYVEKTYAKRGQAVVERNFAAIDRSIERLQPRAARRGRHRASRSTPVVPADAPDFVQQVTAVLMAGDGRPAAGERVAGRRHVPDRDRPRTRSGPSPRRSRSGIRRSASTAASAPWSARTRRSG